jgi:tRNA threonylcarbamoyladenosine biosynthesis protein TsaB
MSWILDIDTSLESATVALSKDGIIIAARSNENQKDHASFLEPAVQALTKEAGIQLSELSAIAVVHGPGSYTGLRVGMASAKGLCYALNKPLILLNNLEVLSMAAIKEYSKPTDGEHLLFSPMIDARRMEVYTAVYDENMTVIEYPHSLILDAESYCNLLTNNTVIFFGNGSEKWGKLCGNKNGRFMTIAKKTEAINQLSFQMLAKQSFTPVESADPLYIKEFYTTQSPSKTV